MQIDLLAAAVVLRKRSARLLATKVGVDCTDDFLAAGMEDLLVGFLWFYSSNTFGSNETCSTRIRRNRGC